MGQCTANGKCHQLRYELDMAWVLGLDINEGDSPSLFELKATGNRKTDSSPI